jgi:hypothetical protein
MKACASVLRRIMPELRLDDLAADVAYYRDALS